MTIEFTESFAFEDYERLRETVSILHKNGFKCSIDDFGSGFSSYNILKELPMDEIKLDRFFIIKGYSDERDLKVLSSVIKLGRELNMKVTQEGVETKDQLMLLKKLGCNVIQGFYYSKPLVEGTMTTSLRENSCSEYFLNYQRPIVFCGRSLTNIKARSGLGQARLCKALITQVNGFGGRGSK